MSQDGCIVTNICTITYSTTPTRTRSNPGSVTVRRPIGPSPICLPAGSVKRLLQAHRRMSRADERAVFEGQYLTLQPSLDGSHVQVNGRLGALEAGICRQGLDRRGESSYPPARPAQTRDRDEPWRSPPGARTKWTASPNPPAPPPNVSARPAAGANPRSWSSPSGNWPKHPNTTRRSGAGRSQGRTRHRGPHPMRRQHRDHHRRGTRHRPARIHHRHTTVSYAEPCSPATTDAPSTDAPTPTVSKSTTSSPAPGVAPTQPATSPRCAGGATTSPHTAEACA